MLDILATYEGFKNYVFILTENDFNIARTWLMRLAVPSAFWRNVTALIYMHCSADPRNMRWKFLQHKDLVSTINIHMYLDICSSLFLRCFSWYHLHYFSTGILYRNRRDRELNPETNLRRQLDSPFSSGRAWNNNLISLSSTLWPISQWVKQPEIGISGNLSSLFLWFAWSYQVTDLYMSPQLSCRDMRIIVTCGPFY